MTPDGIGVGDIGVLRLLADAGLILFRGARADDLRRLVASLGHVVSHPDATESGRTLIAPGARTGANARAFTTFALGPHTDGTASANPPDLVLVWCERPAATGGESIFVDGSGVLGALAADGWTRRRLAADVALRHRGTGRIGPVFVARGGDRLSIRYRDDDVARPVSPVTGLVDTLRSVIARAAVRRPVPVDGGYLLDNGRWLHGRTAFRGDRLMRRVLIRLGERQAASCDLGMGHAA